MHPLLPSRCHWGRTSEWWVCVCVCMEEVNFTDLSEELESLPSGLSSNWSSDLHLSVGAANRPFLWYHFAFATIGMFMCRCVDLWSYLISGKNPHNQAEVRIWPVDWDFGLSASQMISKIDALSCSKMPLLLSCLPISVALLQASEDAGGVLPLSASFTLLKEMRWEQDSIVSAALHGWRFSQ